MNLDKINQLLSDIDNMSSNKSVKRISIDKPEGYGEEQYDGNELQKIEIFDIDEDNVFLKVVTSIDSYGERERITSIQFVKPVKKEVIVYDTI